MNDDQQQAYGEAIGAVPKRATPCTDPGLEARYLGSCMVDGATLETHPVWPRDMSAAGHRAALEGLYALHARGESTDVTSLQLELERRGTLDRAGGVMRLRDLASVVELYPAPIAARIRELAAARSLREQCLTGVVLAEAGDLPEALRIVRQAAEIQHPDANREERYGTLAGAVRLAASDLEVRATTTTKPTYVATGIAALDAAIAGVEYGDLTVIGGDTSAGKSTIAMFMAKAMAMAGHRPGIISCEDAAKRVGNRALAMLSGVPSVKLRRAKDLTEWELGRIRGAVVEAEGIAIELAYCIGEDIDHVEEATRVLIHERGCDVIFLDYVQAVDVPGQDERIAMKTVLTRFKRTLNRATSPASGFALSQLKRRGEKINEKPVRSDLYESGYLEQKADTILLIWRDKKGYTRLVLDKAKDDGTGVEASFYRGSNGVLVEKAIEADDVADLPAMLKKPAKRKAAQRAMYGDDAPHPAEGGDRDAW